MILSLSWAVNDHASQLQLDVLFIFEILMKIKELVWPSAWLYVLQYSLQDHVPLGNEVANWIICWFHPPIGLLAVSLNESPQSILSRWLFEQFCGIVGWLIRYTQMFVGVMVVFPCVYCGGSHLVGQLLMADIWAKKRQRFQPTLVRRFHFPSLTFKKKQNKKRMT